MEFFFDFHSEYRLGDFGKDCRLVAGPGADLKHAFASGQFQTFGHERHNIGLGYGLAWAGCRVLTRNPLCRVDGPLSVEGAFSLPEVLDLAAQCQLQDATIRKQWPERFLMTWETSA